MFIRCQSTCFREGNSSRPSIHLKYQCHLICLCTMRQPRSWTLIQINPAPSNQGFLIQRISSRSQHKSLPWSLKQPSGARYYPKSYRTPNYFDKSERYRGHIHPANTIDIFTDSKGWWHSSLLVLLCFLSTIISLQRKGLLHQSRIPCESRLLNTKHVSLLSSQRPD